MEMLSYNGRQELSNTAFNLHGHSFFAALANTCFCHIHKYQTAMSIGYLYSII